jgi:hypothetical protein
MDALSQQNQSQSTLSVGVPENSQIVTLNDLVPAKDVPKKFPHLYSEKSWQWAVKQRRHNGLAKAFRKIGKNLFVNIPVLAECIDAQSAD